MHAGVPTARLKNFFKEECVDVSVACSDLFSFAPFLFHFASVLLRVLQLKAAGCYSNFHFPVANFHLPVLRRAAAPITPRISEVAAQLCPPVCALEFRVSTHVDQSCDVFLYSFTHFYEVSVGKGKNAVTFMHVSAYFLAAGGVCPVTGTPVRHSHFFS